MSVSLLKAVGFGVAVVALSTFTAPLNARSVNLFDINYHSVGEGSGSRCYEGLCVSLWIKNINVNGDKSRICATFSNSGSGDWKGAYRLTNRDDNTTFSSLRVGAYNEIDKCEILPVQRTYRVVLRQDS